MNGSLRVPFRGPLSPLAQGLEGEFLRLGYAPSTAGMHLGLWADLSRWLDDESLDAAQLSESAIARFLVRRRRGHVVLYSAKSLAPGLAFLRQAGAIPAPSDPVPGTAVDVLLDRFRAYLRVERGVLAATADSYASRARPFLLDRVRSGVLDIESLNAGDVSRFAAEWLPGLAPSAAKSAVTALRSLLRFLHVDGSVAGPLAAAVPTVASWRLSGLPCALAPAQVQALADACDRGTPAGRRDFAVIIMLSRLGLRSAELASLALTDIDWRAGTLTVRGKGNRHEQLSLPVDVGSALADYLRHGRPGDASCRSVFLTLRAPYRILDRKSVGTLVARAARRAGLGTVHAHRLRHSAATATLRAGAPLDEVGQLLRHRRAASTQIYAKVDHRRLAELARVWPSQAGAR